MNFEDNAQHKVFKLTVLGNPQGQGRPRFRRMGKFVQTYDDKGSASEKENIRALATNEALRVNWNILNIDTPVKLKITAYKTVPKTKPMWYQNAARMGLIVPTNKPDFDNVEKLITDALTGIVYLDDKQIFKAEYETKFSDTPRVEVEVTLFYVNLGEIKEQIKIMKKSEKEKAE